MMKNIHHKQQTILLTILREFSIWQMYDWCYTPHRHYFDIYSRKNTYWFPITLYNPPVLSVLYYGNFRHILYINWNFILSRNKDYLNKKYRIIWKPNLKIEVNYNLQPFTLNNTQHQNLNTTSPISFDIALKWWCLCKSEISLLGRNIRIKRTSRNYWRIFYFLISQPLCYKLK